MRTRSVGVDDAVVDPGLVIDISAAEIESSTADVAVALNSNAGADGDRLRRWTGSAGSYRLRFMSEVMPLVRLTVPAPVRD